MLIFLNALNSQFIRNQVNCNLSRMKSYFSFRSFCLALLAPCCHISSLLSVKASLRAKHLPWEWAGLALLWEIHLEDRNRILEHWNIWKLAVPRISKTPVFKCDAELPELLSQSKKNKKWVGQQAESVYYFEIYLCLRTSVNLGSWQLFNVC